MTTLFADQLQQAIKSLKLDSAYERTVQLIEKSPIPHLAPYLDLAVFSFFYFVALDLFVYYILAPRLCKLAPKVATPKGLDKVHAVGHMRLKWAHMIPSFIHALIVSPAAIYFTLTDPHALSLTQHTRLAGFSPSIANMVAFSGGYFLWDLAVCVLNPSVYGPSFTAHALMALVGVFAGFGCSFTFQFYLNRFLIFEISTIFIDLHWFFAKMGYDKTKRQFTADLLGLLCYLVFRMALGYWTSYQLTLDLIDWYKSGKYNLSALIIANILSSTTHILNMYWFIKLASGALGKKIAKGKKD